MTDLTKAQMNTILSALDQQPRNPNTKDAALKAIGRHAEQLGLSVEDLLATTAGLLDGRLSPEAWRAEISERPEGATVEQLAEALKWARHTVRGAMAGALKKKLGLTITTERVRCVGANREGARGSYTVYRLAD
jgi:hypothetical protein